MKELIEKVLEAERSASQKLEEARKRAILIQEEADRDASTIMAEAQKKAAALEQKLMEKAENDSVEYRKKVMTGAEQEAERSLSEVRDRYNEITERMIDLFLDRDGN